MTLNAKADRYRDKLSVVESEIAELDISLSVLERFSDPSVVPSKNEAASSSKPSTKKPDGLPTAKNLVLEALMDARQRGISGLSPREIREFVQSRYSYNMGSVANTTPSRMWRESNEFTKNTETGKFSLPEKIETEDNAVESNTSSVSLFN